MKVPTSTRPSYLYACYFDMVDSSTKKINIYGQIEKLEILNKSIKAALHHTDKNETRDLTPVYSSYTGDGAMFCFEFGVDVLQFLLNLFHHVSEFNKELIGISKIRLRVGISSGETLEVSQFEGKKAPWGRDMVIAKRIMDISAPNQVLVTKGCMEQLKQYHYTGFKFKHKGKHELKHEPDIDVYSMTFKGHKDSFGNDSQPHCNCHWETKKAIKTL